MIVASTEDAHFTPAMAALQAGKTLLVEKPFTILPDEGQKLLLGAEEYGVRIYTGFTQRFRRRYLAIKEHILQGYIGDVTSAKATIYLAESVARAVIARAPHHDSFHQHDDLSLRPPQLVSRRTAAEFGLCRRFDQGTDLTRNSEPSIRRGAS